MQTLQQRLIIYCKENSQQVPFGRHLEAISMSVVNQVKGMGEYDSVKKKDETISVNNYPSKFIPIIDKAIDEYFKNKNKFVKTVSKGQPGRVRYFNYDIPDHKAPAFEAALKKCGMEVKKNKLSHGKAQYCVADVGAANLITLGKTFQKERFFQEKRERAAKLKTIGG